MYSDQMKELVTAMLVKDEKRRPQVIDILRMPFVKMHMMDFVANQGKMDSNFHLTAPRGIQPDAVKAAKRQRVTGACEEQRG